MIKDITSLTNKNTLYKAYLKYLSLSFHTAWSYFTQSAVVNICQHINISI